MSPLKWILLVCFIISVYWLWPLYIILGFIVLGVMMPSSGKSRRRSYKSTYKPFKLKPRKRVVYKAPRYKKPKPPLKGRWLKQGTRQHYRHGRWWPPARKDNTPD